MKKRLLRTTFHRFSVLVSVLSLLIATVTSCSKENDPNRLTDGEYPMKFTASIEGQIATRATADNLWSGTEEVAIQVDSEVKKYTANTDGGLTVADGVVSFYWQSTADRMITAWHPYSAARPISFTVQENQRNNGYLQSDLIYTSQNVTFADTRVTFKHLPTKVVVNLENGEGVTAENVKNAAVSIVNQNLTSGAIDGNWSVAQVGSGNSSITPNVLTTATSGCQKTVQALVVPQKSTTSAKFIKVVVSGQEFFYSTTPDFAAGAQYTYDITVQKNGLTVTPSGAQAWTGNEIPVTSKEIVAGYTPSDLKPGDYYYSDGTWSDGGLRKRYADGTFVKEDVEPVLTDGRTVLGIVYSTDVSRIGDAAKAALEAKGITPHGLVMALTNASESCRWGNENKAESGNFNVSNPFQNNTDNLKKMYENINGYAETQWIVNKIENYGYNTGTYAAFDNASKYGTAGNQPRYAASSTSTGWFIPSMGQWWDILENLGGIALTSYRSKTDSYASISGAAPIAVDNLNKYLQRVKGATQFIIGTYFWSSSEYSSSNACDVNFYAYDDLDLNNNLKDLAYSRVRCSLAF